MDKILLFIPMYNCEKQIIRVLGQLTEEVCSYLSEVIVVNNQSTDNGENVVKKYIQEVDLPIKLSLLRNDENYGLGGSHKAAFDFAIKHGFDYLISLHGDDQGAISDLIPYLENKEYEKYDRFLGSRFMKGSRLDGYSHFRTFGNKVYNILFSIGCGYRVYDLGAGLNMYKVSILKDYYYLKFKDNLMFDYCMIMASAYYKHKVKFFPITWREEDQVSNVKIINQAITTLLLLCEYIFNKKIFFQKDQRDKNINEYTFKIVCSNRQ